MLGIKKDLKRLKYGIYKAIWLFDVPKEAPTDFILQLSYSYIIPQFQNEISHL